MQESRIDITIEEIIKLAKEKNKKIDSKKVIKAYNYAKEKHRRSKKKIWRAIYNSST